MKGRAVVQAGASVITLGPDGDLVGDIVIRDDRIVRAALVRDAEGSRDRLLGQIGTSAEELRFSGQIAVPQQ